MFPKVENMGECHDVIVMKLILFGIACCPQSHYYHDRIFPIRYFKIPCGMDQTILLYIYIDY